MTKIIIAALLFLASWAAYAEPLFTSEATAHAHCPSDTVVWVNTKTGVWHYKGQRWYGRTKYGAYACEK